MKKKINWTLVMAALGTLMFVAEMLTVVVSMSIPHLGYGYPITFFILSLISLECLLFIRYETRVGRWYENISNIKNRRIQKKKNPIKIFKGLFKSKEEELIIPEGWGESISNEVEEKANPVAVNPVFHFIEPSKQRRFGLRLPYRVKRAIAFILLLICCGLIYNTVVLRTIDLTALLYFIPKLSMILYYLNRTQPNTVTMMHMLDNIEKY